MNTNRLNMHMKEDGVAAPASRKNAFSALIPLALVLMSASLFSGCMGLDSDNESGTVPAEQSVAGETISAEKRQPTLESIEQTVSRIRGLPIKANIPISYISREQLQDNLKSQLTEEYPADQAQSEEKALKALGLLDPGANLIQEVEQLLGEGVVGYYDEKTKQLFVVSDSQEITPLNEITLAHEFTHALQDQHFTLSTLMSSGDSTNSDRDLALLSLAEGDATRVEEEYTGRVMSAMDLAGAAMGSMEVLDEVGAAPEYLRDSLEFPYLSGGDFVSYLHGIEGWESVNEAYERLPQSTEQIIHPQKYLGGEAPVPVTIPDLEPVIGSGWNLEDEDVIGEFTVAELLDTQLVRSRSLAAAAGWGGGTYRLYGQGNSLILVMLLTWDTLPDADDFSTAMGESVEKRYGGKFDVSAFVPVLTGSDGAWALAQHESSVAVVLAPDAATASNIVSVLLGI